MGEANFYYFTCLNRLALCKYGGKPSTREKTCQKNIEAELKADDG